MRALLDAFKTLKLWQIGVLAAVLVGAGGATYGVYVLVSGPGRTGLGESQRLIPVQYGNLVNQVSTNGSLIFSNRETLTFGAQGTVGEVLVEEGEQVGEGQPLARLDVSTVASLEQAVTQARVTLRSAEDALAEAKNPHTPLELAQAEANLANARLSPQSAQETLDRLLKPTSQEIAQAEANLANAKLSLQGAQEALDRLLKPTSQEIAQAEAAVTNAKLSAKNAQEALDTVKERPTEKDIAKAQSQVNSSSTALANATGDLSLARREWNGKVKTAEQAFEMALVSYQGVFRKWLGMDLEEIEDVDPDTLLGSRGIDLTALFGPRADSGGRFRIVPADDPGTPWSEVVVFAWTNLFPGLLLPTCESGLIPPLGICIKKEMDDAWDAYQEAKENLETVQTQAAKAIANAESAVTRAEESLAAAREALADLEAGSGPLEIESKEKQLALTLATLQKAEEDLARLQSTPDPLEVEAKQKQVAVAQASLSKAEEALAKLLDPDPLEVEVKQKQVTVAQANLDKAKEALADLQGSVDPLEVALKEAQVTSAQAALAMATERLAGATIKATMAGVVSLVNVEGGQSVNANTPIVEVVDPTVVEIDGVVDEIDVLFVREGAQADVTMDALSGQVLQGTVSAISSAARSQQGVVSYPIRIRVQVPAGVQLREGLSATANIVIQEEDNVLLVPLEALYGTFEQPVVRVMSGGRIEERQVVLGISDGFWAAVRQGLAEGEQVVMEAQTATTGQFGFGGAVRQFQGQFPGALPGGFQTGGSGRQPVQPTPGPRR